MGLYQTKKASIQQGNNIENKETAYRCKKIFVNDTSIKGSISRIYKEFNSL